jgi:hypothetical protein
VLNDFNWSVVYRRQTPTEFDPSAVLDAGNEMTQHIVEELDLIFAEAFAVVIFPRKNGQG